MGSDQLSWLALLSIAVALTQQLLTIYSRYLDEIVN